MQKGFLRSTIFARMKWCPLLCLGILIFLAACSSDNQSDTPVETSFKTDLLIERWEVDRAFRNGKPAASLDGLYFDFTQKDTLTTNMMGHGISEVYEIVGDTIKTNGESNLYFVVAKLDSARLTLETNLRATPFKFQLKPAELEVE